MKKSSNTNKMKLMRKLKFKIKLTTNNKKTNSNNIKKKKKPKIILIIIKIMHNSIMMIAIKFII